MQREQAYIEHRNVDQSGRVSQLSVHVQHRHGSASISLLLEPPLAGESPEAPTVAGQLRLLGEALIRIADEPKSIFSHDPQRS